MPEESGNILGPNSVSLTNVRRRMVAILARMWDNKNIFFFIGSVTAMPAGQRLKFLRVV